MKYIFNLLQSARRNFLRVSGIRTFGVRVIIKTESSVFLVKHRYGDYWVFPGGRRGRTEDPERAAMREAREEAGINISSFDRTLGVYANTSGGKNDVVTVLVADDWRQMKGGRPWSIEILEAGFFPLDDLPESTSPATRRRVEELREIGQAPRNTSW